jgi:poly(hydroxyalkanoate) depolymerase family esterase
LVVILHGCLMNDTQMATGTNMNQFAAERGFVVLYPIQTSSDNVMSCWSWFDTSNLQRNDGEASIIVGMVQDLIAKYNLDDSHLAIAGLSAGAGLASDMLGCYSDVFQGGLIQSGFEYGAAQSESEGDSIMSTGSSRNLDTLAAQAYACSPKRTMLMPVIVVQGSADPYVNPVNANRVFSFFTKLNTLISKGAGTNLTAVQKTGTMAAASSGGYSTNVTYSQFNGQTMVSELLVQGMGHAWSGGVGSPSQYMDPNGPSDSQMLTDLFFPAGYGQ